MPSPSQTPAPPREQTQMEFLCSSDDMPLLTADVRAYVRDANNICRFAGHYYFGRLFAPHVSGSPFYDAEVLHEAAAAAAWPQRVEVVLGDVCGVPGAVARIVLHYAQLRLGHGQATDPGTAQRTLHWPLHEAERVLVVVMAYAAPGRYVGGYPVVPLVRLSLGVESQWPVTPWLHSRAPEDKEHELGAVEVAAPPGFMGLKGFHGAQGGVVDTLGPI